MRLRTVPIAKLGRIRIEAWRAVRCWISWKLSLNSSACFVSSRIGRQTLFRLSCDGIMGVVISTAFAGTERKIEGLTRDCKKAPLHSIPHMKT